MPPPLKTRDADGELFYDRILQYRVDLVQPMRLPKTAIEFCHAGEQYGDLMIWYRCNNFPLNEQFGREKRIYVFGTGQDIPPGLKYLASVQMRTGLVWHLFEGDIE